MSNKRKNSRKYKKELKIPENYVREEFDYEKIKDLADKNGLIVFLKGNDNILEIHSKMNKWRCNIDSKDVINLYHITTEGNPHWQNNYLDYEYMFNSIRTHDLWMSEENTGGRVFDVFKQLASGNIPKISFN